MKYKKYIYIYIYIYIYTFFLQNTTEKNVSQILFKKTHENSKL